MAKEFDLTAREAEIAELFAKGKDKQFIANFLFLSYYTVDNHLRNIYKKTGAHSLNGLSAWWFNANYGISLDISQAKRSVIAIALLLLILPKEFSLQSESYRPGKASRSMRTKIGRSGRKGRETDFTNYL